MQTAHKLTHTLLTLIGLLILSGTILAQDPGLDLQAIRPNDMQSGNCLVYNIYTSSAANPASQNTRISITNADDEDDIAVHFYYIDGDTCSVADNYVCLTKNQTTTFYASDIDPGITGYIIAMSTDEDGAPTLEGNLIGDEQVKFASGHLASLGAVATLGIALFPIDNGSAGIGIKILLPRVLAVSNIPSPAEGNNTLLILNRIGGDLRVSAAPIGNLFGIIYDQLENPYSWTARAGCQLRRTLDNSFPRTSPRLSTIIPGGSVGWMKFWSVDTDPVIVPGEVPTVINVSHALLGSVLFQNANANASATAFNGGHNLHSLTYQNILQPDFTVFIFPVFPPNCD